VISTGQVSAETGKLFSWVYQLKSLRQPDETPILHYLSSFLLSFDNLADPGHNREHYLTPG